MNISNQLVRFGLTIDIVGAILIAADILYEHSTMKSLYEVVKLDSYWFFKGLDDLDNDLYFIHTISLFSLITFCYLAVLWYIWPVMTHDGLLSLGNVFIVFPFLISCSFYIFGLCTISSRMRRSTNKKLEDIAKNVNIIVFIVVINIVLPAHYAGLLLRTDQNIRALGLLLLIFGFILQLIATLI